MRAEGSTTRDGTSGISVGLLLLDAFEGRRVADLAAEPVTPGSESEHLAGLVGSPGRQRNVDAQRSGVLEPEAAVVGRASLQHDARLAALVGPAGCLTHERAADALTLDLGRYRE